MRILHVIASVSPARGGTSMALWTMLHALRQQGIEAHVATTDDDGAISRAGVPLGRFVDVEGLQCRYFPRQTRFYSASMPLAMWLLKHCRDYDLLHVHGLFGFVPAAAANIARIRGVPYVLSTHGMLDRWGRDSRRPFLKQWSLRLVEGPMLRHAARIHFTSERELEQAKDLAIPAQAAVIPMGFDGRSSEVKSMQSADTESNTEPNTGPTILFLSRIDRVKGLDLLLEAFAEVRSIRNDAKLIVAGDGPDSLVRELKELAADLGIGRDVEWPGFVHGKAKRDLLAKASIFALTSRSENFSYAVVEAMAAGLPVIVSNAIGVAGLVGRFNAGVVTDLTRASIRDAMLRLLQDTKLRGAMSSNGVNAIHGELSLERFGRSLADLYRPLVVRQAQALPSDAMR